MNNQTANDSVNPSDVVIATTTFYRGSDPSSVYRAELAIGLVQQARELGHQVAIVDGGSSDEVVARFKDLGAIVEQERDRGMGKSVRQVIQLAQDIGKPVIAWTEPEKLDYVGSIVKTARPIISDTVDLVVPARISMDSYPTAQQWAEPFGNAFWRELTGANLDMWFGPRTWGRAQTRYFLEYDGRHGDKWDSIFVPVMDAIHGGKRVVSVGVDYKHPARQTAGEEHDLTFYTKRVEQLDNLMKALKAHADEIGFKKKE